MPMGACSLISRTNCCEQKAPRVASHTRHTFCENCGKWCLRWYDPYPPDIFKCYSGIVTIASSIIRGMCCCSSHMQSVSCESVHLLEYDATTTTTTDKSNCVVLSFQRSKSRVRFFSFRFVCCLTGECQGCVCVKLSNVQIVSLIKSMLAIQRSTISPA